MLTYDKYVHDFNGIFYRIELLTHFRITRGTEVLKKIKKKLRRQNETYPLVEGKYIEPFVWFGHFGHFILFIGIEKMVLK